MKNYLLLILAASGLMVFSTSESKSQDFSVNVGDVPGYYASGYYEGGYCDPGYGYYYYHRRVYYGPAYYPGYYYGGYHRHHHRHHQCEDDD